jgi:uncharacterized protein YbaP (TraB family)
MSDELARVRRSMPPLRRLLVTLFALLLPACAPLDAPAANAADAWHGPAIWKVADKDTTIYLFGTIHALPDNKAWFSGPVARAFDGSQELVTEFVNMGNVSDAIRDRGRLPQGTTLRSLMTATDRMKFEETLVSFGVPVEALDNYKPWYAAFVLTNMEAQKAGFDVQSGPETVLADAAGDRRQAGLETVQQQIDIFDGLPQPEQLAFLNETVGTISQAQATLDAYYAKWMAGDADGLAVMLNAELDDPLLHRRLLTDRNARWAQWIDRRLQQPGTVFVAVGAGHLAGSDSVQQQLKKRGIRARRLWQ